MAEITGVLAALLSSAIGGLAVAATRYLAEPLDPVTLGALRFGTGCAFLLPVALLRARSWPARSDRPAVAGLGLLFFAAFPLLFNASLASTTAARGALALSTLPLLTMLAGALLGVEALTMRKGLGVATAVAGVALALLSGLADAPVGAWRGDLLMVAAAACMALYSVWSRPLIARYGAIPFTAWAMTAGAAALAVAAALSGGLADVARLGPQQWTAVAWLGLFGGAVTFFLWAFALGRTTPTRVAVSVTANPVTASALGVVLLDEAVGWNLAAGLLLVCLGIWLAATEARAGRPPAPTAPSPG